MWFAGSATGAGIGRLENQDRASFSIIGDCLVAAVSDGAGSASHGADGARVIVETALNYFMHDGDTKDFISNVRIALGKRAHVLGVEMMDLAATMVVVVATQDKTTCIQVGDGFGVVSFEDEAYALLIQPDKGEYINQTSFVTLPDAADHVKVATFEKRARFLCLSTDGLESVALFHQNWEPYGGFFNPLDQYISKTDCQKELDLELAQFLESDSLRAKSWDDKSIILGCWKD